MENNQNELKFTYSCILPRGKDKIVRVTFERKNGYAEGIVPDGKIEKQNGFSQKEVEQLEQYLKANKDTIMKQARDITGISHWF